MSQAPSWPNMSRRHALTILLAAATEAMQVGPRTATAPHAEPSCLQDVAAFHSLFGAPVVDEPALPDAKRCALRVNLLQEELDEFKAALEAGDVVEAADALADIQYVLAGAVHELGMGSRFKAVSTQGSNPGIADWFPDRSATHAFEPRLGQLFDEVHRSNMSKACVSREEAEATVAHYADKGQPAHIEEVAGKFLVKRTADNKVQPLRTATAPVAPPPDPSTAISPSHHRRSRVSSIRRPRSHPYSTHRPVDNLTIK